MCNKRFASILVVLPIIFMLLVPVAVPAAEKVIQWRMQVLWDSGTLPYKIEERFVNRVKELTNGSQHPTTEIPKTMPNFPMVYQ